MYCPEIKKVLETSEVIRTSTEKYEGETRRDKYKILALAGKFTKSEDMARFNKNRCKPGFNDQEIVSLNIEIEKAERELRDRNKLFQVTLPAKDSTISESDAIAFLKDEPMLKIQEQYFRLHHGDPDALSTVVWGYCVKWVKTALDEGIHIIAVGTRGAGKSHGITTAMMFLPPELAWIKGITPRYLYYADNLKRGLTVYLDELPSDQALLDALKAIITAYPNGGSRGTVHDGKSQEQNIPARITINTSAVDQKADEQFTNRLTVIRSSADNKKARIDFRLKLYAGNVEPVDGVILERIHNALRYISTRNFIVTVPEGAVYCDNDEDVDIRVLNQFMSAIMGNAILHFPNRFPVVNGEDVHILVTEDDFNHVIHLYQDPDEYLLKLTPSAKAIKDHLEKIYPNYASVGEIASALKTSTQTVRNTINGRKDRNTESLINSGFVEEVSLTDPGKEIDRNDCSGQEIVRKVAPTITSRVYRSTRGLPDKPVVKKKKEEGTNAEIAKFVAMVHWNQSKFDEYVANQQTRANQPLVCTKPSLNNILTNQTNQKVREGV